MGVYRQMAISIGKVMFKSSKFRGTPLQTNPYGTVVDHLCSISHDGDELQNV